MWTTGISIYTLIKFVNMYTGFFFQIMYGFNDGYMYTSIDKEEKSILNYMYL